MAGIPVWQGVITNCDKCTKWDVKPCHFPRERKAVMTALKQRFWIVAKETRLHIFRSKNLLKL